MKAFLKMILILAMCSIGAIAQQSNLQIQENFEDLPKLPLYVGSGYNLLLGNPLSTLKVDPGFTQKIFNFTYKNKETTEDGKYQIPDDVNEIKTTSCSYNSMVEKHSGTQSYQKKLQTKVEIGGGCSIQLVEASFSFSTSFEKIHNQTIVSNYSITQAMAECERYKLSVGLFNILPVTNNFKAGAEESYHSNNWDKFIEQFGTHFAYEVIMGGRAIQEIQYSYESVSRLEAINIDINVAAKASFAKFYGDRSFDWKSYQTSIAYSETQKSSIQEIYIGGVPPTDGNVQEWQQKVIDDPMPITYKVLPLSELFPKMNSTKIKNATDAQASFMAGLDKYCTKMHCKKADPDKPKPPPAKVTEMDTRTFGNTNTDAFSWKMVNPTLEAKKFKVGWGKYVDRLQIMLSDGVQTFYSPTYGGTGGGDNTWQVPDGDSLHQIEVYCRGSVSSLTFITKSGKKSPRFGGTDGSDIMLTIPDGYRIVGIFGKQGWYIDMLGFHLAKSIYSSTGEEIIEEKDVILYDNLSGEEAVEEQQVADYEIE